MKQANEMFLYLNSKKKKKKRKKIERRKNKSRKCCTSILYFNKDIRTRRKCESSRNKNIEITRKKKKRRTLKMTASGVLALIFPLCNDRCPGRDDQPRQLCLPMTSVRSRNCVPAIHTRWDYDSNKDFYQGRVYVRLCTSNLRLCK